MDIKLSLAIRSKSRDVSAVSVYVPSVVGPEITAQSALKVSVSAPSLSVAYTAKVTGPHAWRRSLLSSIVVVGTVQVVVTELPSTTETEADDNGIAFNVVEPHGLSMFTTTVIKSSTDVIANVLELPLLSAIVIEFATVRVVETASSTLFV